MNSEKVNGDSAMQGVRKGRVMWMCQVGGDMMRNEVGKAQLGC